MKQTLKIGDKVKIVDEGRSSFNKVGIFIGKKYDDYLVKFPDQKINDDTTYCYQINQLQLIKVKTKKVNGHYNCWYCGSKNYLATKPQPIKEECKHEGDKTNFHPQFCTKCGKEFCYVEPKQEESKDIEKRDSVFYESRLKDTLLNVGFTEELLLAILKELEKVNSLTKRNIK